MLIKANQLVTSLQYMTNETVLAIPGTRYSLFASDDGDAERAASFLSDDLLKFLAENRGLVIESREDELTVYCYRWNSIRRQLPANLPAFMEDVLYLR